MKKVLLLGACSTIGFNFLKKYSKTFNIIPINRTLPENNYLNVVSCSFDSKSILDLIGRENPDFIINCIAIGNIDYCELNKVKAKSTNFNFVKNIVDAIKENSSCKLIHFSSNAVYSGKDPLYDETSAANPINYYGYTKKIADDYVKDTLDKYIILRPISVYGYPEKFQRNNPINWLLDELLANKNVSLVDDIFNNMLYVDDVSTAIKNSIMLNVNGELNLSSDESLSLYEIGLIICKILQIDESLISKVDSSIFLKKENMAPRPKNTSFNNSYAKKRLKMEFSTIQDGVKNILKIKQKL